ncbi:YolD-like family protein [Cohnella mopanensis]|uniref:YolD-like family protein n=1 Tax=Cohnella mopanensis TaxID=2911966 RepID=UPI001EF7D57C|nr:YolD-like family protein [Cohnella mopanensis]
MKNKLDANGLWQTKFLLPEHKEALIRDSHHVENWRGNRPEIDPQERELIMRVLMESLGQQTVAQFRLYDPYEECAVIGIVERVDPYTRTFMVDGERFKMADIIGATAV